MLDLVTVTWTILLAGSPAGSISFPQVRYREVFFGDVAEAAERYERLYLGRRVEDRATRMDIQAAFRAGLCFEKLGRLESARLAYDWMQRQRGDAEDARSRALISEAALRLQILRPEQSGGVGFDTGGSASRGDLSPDVSTGLVINEWLDRERARSARLREALVALESELGIHRERLMERARLRSRLADVGVLLQFGEEEPTVDGDLESAFKERIPEILANSQEGRKLEFALADRHLERALSGLVSRNWLQARSHLRVAGAFSPNPTVAERWLAWIGEKAFRPAQAALLARRRLLDEQLASGSSLRRDARALLEKAEQVISDRGRPDLAVGYLDRIREQVDWARPSLREDLELRELSDRADKMLEFLARGCGEGDAVLRQSRERRENVGVLISLASEFTMALEEWLRLGGRSRLEGRPDALDACRAEMDRLVYGARDALARGDRLEAQRLLRDGATLLGWVPAVDPRGEYVEALGELRQTPVNVLESTGAARGEG